MPDVVPDRALGPVPRRRPSAVLAHTRHATRAFLRTPVAAFFALVFPLIWLTTIVLVVGNPAVGPPGGTIPLAQLLTPVAAVFAAAMGAFVAPAAAVVIARERGDLKRLRGTPSPPAAFLAGQVLCAAGVALLGVVLAVAAGAVVWGVRLDPAGVPAAVVALVVGVAAFASLALAVAALVPSPAAAQAVAIGLVIVLSFVSDMFTSGTRPGPLDAVGWWFPLRHLVAALRDPFDPFTDGGFPATHLAVIAAWGLAGAVVAWRAFRWEPRGHTGPVGRRPARHDRPHRRTALRLVLGQVSYTDRTMWRDVAAWFFALAFPVLLLVLLGSLLHGEEFDGVPYAQALVPGVAAYGVAVTAFVNLPEALATARDRGVLRRLRGTPLPAWAQFVGRLGSALWLGGLTTALVIVTGVVLFDVHIALRGLPALVLVLVLGTACLLALGTALAALLRTATAFGVVSLAVLLPVSFLSGLFPFGVPEPAFVRAIASVFPLQHVGDALDEALRATSWTPVAWPHLAVLAAWTLVGVVAATVRRSIRPRPTPTPHDRARPAPGHRSTTGASR